MLSLPSTAIASKNGLTITVSSSVVTNSQLHVLFFLRRRFSDVVGAGIGNPSSLLPLLTFFLTSSEVFLILDKIHSRPPSDDFLGDLYRDWFLPARSDVTILCPVLPTGLNTGKLSENPHNINGIVV